MFGGKPFSGSREAGLDFVGDKKDAVLAADILQKLEIVARWDDEATFALNWFDWKWMLQVWPATLSDWPDLIFIRELFPRADLCLRLQQSGNLLENPVHAHGGVDGGVCPSKPTPHSAVTRPSKLNL